MPYYRVYIHLIWSTKCRSPIITNDLKTILIKHIRENAVQKRIFIDSINCVSDHMHLLISLGMEQNISKIVMLIKGESSFWINKQKLLPFKFEWQEEYGVFSVNYKELHLVRDYIAFQEEHHRKTTFMEEYERFITEQGAPARLAKASSGS